jgi:prophage antirepressor-like protein
MNEIQVFSNEKFGQVRGAMIDGEPWLVGKDVAERLLYSNPQKAIRDHVDSEDRGVNEMDTPGGKQMVVMINESGLYSLIFGSKLDKAKEFKHWVTSEVLPTIRKTGGYVHNSEVFIQNYLPFADDTTKQLFRLTLDVVDKQNKQIADQQKELAEKSSVIEEMTPKASYYDLVINSPSLVPITAIAKDFGLSAIALNRLLHTEGIQFLNNNMWVLYQKYADKGYVGTKTYAYPNKAGKMVNTRMQTFWTQKGRLFIYNLLKGKGILPIMERGVA